MLRHNTTLSVVVLHVVDGFAVPLVAYVEQPVKPKPVLGEDDGVDEHAGGRLYQPDLSIRPADELMANLARYKLLQ